MARITPCVKDGLLHFFEGGWQCGICVESNTTLYTFGQRYYDTDLGRWTQMDPVGGTVDNPNSGNPYVYASDAPNMKVDPTGRDVSFNNACIAGAIVGVALFALAAFIAAGGGPLGLFAVSILASDDVAVAALVGCLGNALVAVFQDINSKTGI